MDRTSTDRARGRLAFVPPRYGTEIVGGSEAVMREAARGLAARGWDVEVLTTCARDHYTWANTYPAGTFDVDGLRLRRFPVVPGRRSEDLDTRLGLGLSISRTEEIDFLNGVLRV